MKREEKELSRKLKTETKTETSKAVKTDIFNDQNKGKNFIAGVSRINKNDFFDNFDYGTPNHVSRSILKH